MNNRQIQMFLKAKGHYKAAIDGALGPISRAAMKAALGAKARGWSRGRLKVGTQQLMCKAVGISPGPIDGLPGPLTYDAIAAYDAKQAGKPAPDNSWRNYKTPAAAMKWPLQSGCDRFYGVPKVQVPGRMIRVPTPFTLWYGDMAVNQFYVHRKCADSLVRVFEEILSVYGEKEIHRLRIDRYAGIYNPRRMRGGSAWSMHSYGCAIDLDPVNNQLRWGRDRAHFARPEYEPLHAAFEREGWINLGREANFDFMHWQAARLR